MALSFSSTTTAATPSNTSLFGSLTPVNQNRTSNNLFGNTTATQPSALSSTPFGSTTLFGAASPTTTTLQPGSSGAGTIHKFDPPIGLDKVNKGSIPTQIRTKTINICAMPVYEKKSMEELRLEDYIDNRKFPSSTTTTGTTLFSSTTTPLFGGTSATITPATTSATSLFGTNTSTASSTLSTSLFGNKPAMTTAATLPFSFGSTTTTAATPTPAPFTFGSSTAATTTTASPFAFGGSTTTTAAATQPSSFAFGSSAPSVSPFGTTTTTTSAPFTFGSTTAPATTTPAFGFGGGTSLFPATTAPTTGTSFGFAVSKPATTSTFSFTPSTATSTGSSFGFFPNATTATTAAPTLFSTANQPVVAQPVLTTQSSVDTRTHLQLFQTMLNIQPFNSELGFLARNIKPNIGLERNRIRTVPDSSTTHPINNIFTSLIPKPSVLASNTSTPPSALANPIQTHSHTLPSVLLPSTTTTQSINLFGKRKLADSFLDDDDHSLMMDDGPSLSINTIAKTNALKRPRILDMNKVRSVVLGNGGVLNENPPKEEAFSDTFTVKSTSDNLSGWKKFANYDAYLASKKQQQQQIENIKLTDNDNEDNNKQIESNEIKSERAFRLPRLTHDDYYTKPTIDELRHYFNEKGQCFVKEFTVGREHYGSVTFQGSKINLAGLDLNELIEIGRRQVTVYPDDKNKPPEGEELNCPAIISLLGVYPIDRSASNRGEEITDPDKLLEINYSNYLLEMTKKFNGKFLNYDVRTGTWTFKVDHF